jgi:hypothetical protein
MTAKIDGTNGLLQSYDYQVLTTGFTYTFAAGTQVLVAVPAATLATGTVTMPSAPADGMVITIQSSQQSTALTLNGNTGQTVVGTAVQLVPNQPLSWVYRLTNTTWYPFAGGAGRASSLVSGTSVASTSGTSIDFTSIPSWVKRIIVMFSSVSVSGSSNPQVQIGSGSVTTSGYLTTGITTTNAGVVAGNSFTSGFVLAATTGSTGTSTLFHGQLILSLIGSNTWVGAGQFANTGTTTSTTTQGTSSALSGALDRVRITTVNGTDTFDLGTINIQYE